MRPKISSEIKRLVRQKCGFGCVICRCPIYDYDHLQDYSKVKEHTAENIVLLCPTCHRKKTNKLIDVSVIERAIEGVKNNSFTRPDPFPQGIKKISLGNNDISMSKGTPFFIHGFGEIRFEYNNGILLSGYFLDGKGKPAIIFEDNEYIVSVDVWDLEYVGHTLTFRDAIRKVFVSIEFDIASGTLKITGNIDIGCKQRLYIKNEGIFLGDVLLASHNSMYQCTVGGIFVINEPLQHKAWFAEVAPVHNTFVGLHEIALLNCKGAQSNVLQSCQFAMMWEFEWLKNLHGSS